MEPVKTKMKEKVNEGEGRESHCEIRTDNANDWLNICSWLIECPTKTLMIESDNYKTESNPKKEINTIHDSKDVKKETECSKLDYKHDISVGKKIREDNHEGNESTGENPCLENGDEIKREITQSVNVNNENDIPNGEKSKHIEFPKENRELILKEGKINDYCEDDEEEEEYYIIEEEIIEDDNENEEINGDIKFRRTEEKEHKRTEEKEYERTREKKKKRREKEDSELEVKRGLKRKEYEVFVGGINRTATRHDVYEVFSKTGEIQSIRMSFFPLSGYNKGYAFVRYATKEQAKTTLKELEFPLVRGKRCEVRESHENDVLFLGHICKLWNKDHLKHKLKSYGITNYKELTLIQDSRNEGMNKGFAFLEFWSLPDAQRVYDNLRKSRLTFGTPRILKVSFAKFDEYNEFNPHIMAKVTTVFIDWILPEWEEDYVISCLKKYGTIKQVKLAKNMKTAKRLDFGYVTFDSHENAVKCVECLNEKGFGRTGHSKTKVRAALSRPRIKPKIRPGAESSFDRHFSISPLRKRSRYEYYADIIPTDFDSFENYEKRIISNKRSEYSFDHIEERRHYRDEDYYYPCDDYYREGYMRNSNKSGRSSCQYEDDDLNIYDEPRSNSRHGRSHSSKKDDICYRDDNIRVSNSSRYYVGGGSDMFQGCPCCVKREYFWK